MRRYEDWPERLARFVEGATGRPFVWGERDCALWAADWIETATGIDPASDYRGRYRTERGAARALTTRGHGGVAAAFTAALGEDRVIAVAYAQRGDLVCWHGPQGDTIGICVGMSSAFIAVGGGLVHMPTLACRQAWRV